MNTDIDFMNIAEGDKEFVRDFRELCQRQSEQHRKDRHGYDRHAPLPAAAGVQGVSRLYESPRIQLPQRDAMTTATSGLRASLPRLTATS